MAIADMLDKMCDIYGLSTTVSGIGETVHTWIRIATSVPCAMRWLTADWGVTANREEATERVRFYFLPTVTLKPGYAIVCDGTTYIVLGWTNVRNHHLEALAEIRTDVSIT